MQVPIGVSNRHVHLTKDTVNQLFGEGYQLTKKKDITQPGQYVCEERVVIKSDAGEFQNVAIIGPERPYSQVELSKNDARKLHLDPPIRDSGDLTGSSPITIIGPKGEISLEEGCIIPNRHLHIHPDDLATYGLYDGMVVAIEVPGIKGGIMQSVFVKASSMATFEVHIDTDDANAHLINHGELGTIIIGGSNETRD